MMESLPSMFLSAKQPGTRQQLTEKMRRETERDLRELLKKSPKLTFPIHRQPEADSGPPR